MVALATVGGPDAHVKGAEESSIMHGLTEAIKVLCEPTVLQQALDISVIENEPVNKGRIVCLTTATRLDYLN